MSSKYLIPQLRGVTFVLSTLFPLSYCVGKFIPPYRANFFYLLFPKGEFEWSHLFECSLSFILLCWKIYTPLRSKLFYLLFCVWSWWWGAYLPLKFLRCLKMRLFFFNVFNYEGGRLKKKKTVPTRQY